MGQGCPNPPPPAPLFLEGPHHLPDLPFWGLTPGENQVSHGEVSHLRYINHPFQPAVAQHSRLISLELTCAPLQPLPSTTTTTISDSLPLTLRLPQLRTHPPWLLSFSQTTMKERLCALQTSEGLSQSFTGSLQHGRGVNTLTRFSSQLSQRSTPSDHGFTIAVYRVWPSDWPGPLHSMFEACIMQAILTVVRPNHARAG